MMMMMMMIFLNAISRSLLPSLHPMKAVDSLCDRGITESVVFSASTLLSVMAFSSLNAMITTTAIVANNRQPGAYSVAIPLTVFYQ